MKKKKAFTLIELMMSLALLALLLGIPILYTQASQVRFDFNTQVSVLVSYVRLAQSDTVSGKDNAPHGVHLDSGAYVIFTGTSYNPSDPGNFTIDLPATIEIRNVVLNGGGSDVIFERINGETTHYGTFELHSEQINKSLTITVNSLGNINY